MVEGRNARLSMALCQEAAEKTNYEQATVLEALLKY